MKRALLAALAALTFAAPAHALLPLTTSSKPRTLRVALVHDNNNENLTLINQRANRWHVQINPGITGLVAALQAQGAQVDAYNQKFFLLSANMTNSEATLWKNLGDTYALAIIVTPNTYGSKTAGAGNYTRFTHPDSTNVQLLLVTGTTDAGRFADSSYSSSVATPTSSTLISSSGHSVGAIDERMAYRLYGSTDTIWVSVAKVNARSMGTPAGVSPFTGVRRILEPVALNPTRAWYGSSDSTAITLPAEGDSTAAEATAGSHEALGIAWRVMYASGRWVDVYGGANGYSVNNYAYGNTGMIAYAMAARYLTLKPMKRAVELDDFFDPSPNGQLPVAWDPVTDSWRPSELGRRWTNEAIDSLFTRWKAEYNCQPVASVNPLHAYQYMRAENPTYEMDWWWGVGNNPWTWVSKWKNPWVHHSHDSSAARPTSNLVGRFGGYDKGNGLGDFISPHTVYRYHRMRAFAWQPGHDEPEKRYGIYQRLLYSDSLRRIVCPECPVPPYLSFPDNAVLPVNYRMRTAAGNWASYRTVADSLCTVDSTFLAIARGLRVPSGGTLYLRGYFYNGLGSVGATPYLTRPWGYMSVLNFFSKRSHYDSLIAHTPFQHPGEEIIVRDPYGNSDVTGSGTPYWVRVKNVGSVVMDYGTPKSGQYDSSWKLGQLMGISFGTQDGAFQSAFDSLATRLDTYGRQYSTDPHAIMAETNLTLAYWPYTKDCPRIIYFHPSANYTAGTNNGPAGPGHSWSTWNFERTILRPVRALNALAGYEIVKWVWPWEVYNE